MAKPIVISILANASQANATLDKTSGIMGKVGKAGRVMALGAGVGLLALGGVTKGLVADAREAAKVTANTNAVIKATGGVAGVSAKHVDTLATSLSRKTGIDDEAVASGANLLLTFKNIKKAGGIFDRATTSALDLSAAGFGSVESASKTLGKALNDPVKGVSALSKQGVTFSQVQKDQIANFVKTGRVAKAQSLILKEVESQVGGQAAAQATAGDKLRVTVGNIREQLGAKLIPVLDRAATYLNDKLPGWITTAGAAFTSLKGYVLPIVATVRSFFGTFDNGTSTTASKFAQFQATVSTVLTAVSSVFSSAVSIVTSLWSRFGSDITRYATESLTNVLTFVRGAFTVLAGIFKTVAALLKGDWSGVWEGIKQIARGALTAVGALVRQGLNIIRTAFSVIGKTIGSITSAAFGALASLAAAGVNKLVDLVQAIPGKITAVFSNAKTLLSDIGGFLIDGLVSGISGAAQRVYDKVAEVGNKVKAGFKNVLEVFSPSRYTRALGRFVSKGLELGLLDGVSGIVSAVTKTGAKTKAELKKQTREILAQVKAAGRERLQALKAQRAEYAVAVAGAARDYASLGNLTLGDNETLSTGGIAQFLNDRLSAINNFNAKLASIRGRVSSAVYNQIVQLGVEQGTGYAEALSTASPAALAQINSLQAQIDGASSALGSNTANAMYAAGIQSAQGYYDGLQSMLNKIAKQGTKIAKSLIKELKKALDINSPSRKLKRIGVQSVDGLDDGLDERRVQDKGRVLAKSLVKGYASPQLDAQFTAGFRASDTSTGSAGKATGDTYNITVRMESGMTQEQMGVAYNNAIEAAKKIGMVRS